MSWRALTPGAARAHPRHGLRGWLGALFALHLLLLSITVLATLSVALDPESVVVADMTGPRWTHLAIAWGMLAATAGFPLFAIWHSRWTATGAAAGYLCSLLAGAVVWWRHPAAGDGPALLVEAALYGIILRYLFLGTAPNVTFRHRVRT